MKKVLLMETEEAKDNLLLKQFSIISEDFFVWNLIFVENEWVLEMNWYIFFFFYFFFLVLKNNNV